MDVKLFVGNLPWNIRDEELASFFSKYGQVKSSRVITDRDTGRSRGFGFVEMEGVDLATVIRETDGHELAGRALRVNEAQEKSRSAPNPGGNRRY